MVHGIALVDRHVLGRDDALRVENRRGVHPQHTDHAPQKLGVPEEHHQCGQDEAHPDAETHQTDQSKGQQQDGRPNGRTRQQHHRQQGDEGQQQIDGRGKYPGHRVYILGHIYLGNQRGVAHDGLQTHGSGLAEEVEAHDTGEQIQPEVGDVRLEQGGEHNILDHHGQQWVEETPQYAQYRALVLGFEVPRHQLAH